MIKKVKEIANWFYKSLLKNKKMINDSHDIIPNMYKIFLKDIRFVVSHNHEIKNAIKIVTIDDLEYYKIMSLNSFLKMTDGLFVRSSKFEILNLAHIDKRYEHLYCWSGSYQFKISRRYRQTFIEQLEKFYS